MDTMNYQIWTNFYMEFASKLLVYKNNRTELIDKMKKANELSTVKFPKLENDETFYDIDPFTVFGMFNKGITNENRIAVLKGIAAEFDITKEIPTVFDGIPVLNNMNALFFGWGDDRKEHDINNLWNIFEVAINYANMPSDKLRLELASLFDAVKVQSCVKWKITIGLYWIRPYKFMNLDGLNRDYLLNDKNNLKAVSDIQPKLKKGYIPSGDEYLLMCEKCTELMQSEEYKFKNFPELSYFSWISKNDEKVEKDSTSNANFLKWFNPLIEALKNLGGEGTPNDVREQIITDMSLSEDIVNEVRGKNKVNKFANDIAFARNYLVYEGIIDKTTFGLWKLTQKGYEINMTPELASEIFTKWVKINSSKRKDNVEAQNKTIQYWVYAPGNNAEMWDEFYSKQVMAIGWGEMGDLTTYTSKEKLKQKMTEVYGREYSYVKQGLNLGQFPYQEHPLWQFANDIKEGDVIFAIKGLYSIVGRGIVTSEYIFDDSQNEYKHIRNVEWTDHGEWKHDVNIVQRVLTNVTPNATPFPEYISKLVGLFEEGLSVSVEEKVIKYPVYSKNDFLQEVYISEEQYSILTNTLKRKKNIILQGAPGVGKTFAAKKLAYSVMGFKDVRRVMTVQFHQSYSYEDFIMGYRPDGNGFKLVKGAFYKFCKSAEIDNENDYFFIIDEINRGNLSKIFGELFMLIEHDKRDIQLQLLYSDEKFSVPKNVHIIGMMNTADRSLAMLDYALRRRFAFFELIPGFDSEGFKAYQLEIGNEKFDSLIMQIKLLNNQIEQDESLGAGFRIGHSYFIKIEEDIIDDMWLDTVVNYEVLPLLQEYWFDEPSKVKEWSGRLKGAIR